MRYFRPLPSLALVLVAACAPAVTPAGAPSAEETRVKKAFVALRGTVTAPTGLIGNDGSTLIGNDGSTLIGNDGSTLIGNDGSTLIGNDGSTLLSGVTNGALRGPGGGNLRPARRLQAFAAAPLAGAMVYVASADGKPLKPLIKARTDAQGRFTLANVPAGRHVLVALGTTPEQKVASLLGLVTAVKAEDGIVLSAASSLITGAVLAARAQDALAEFDTPSYQRAVTLAEKALAAGDAPDLTARPAVVARAQALAAGDAELGKLLGALQQQVAGQALPSGGPATAAPAASPTPTPTPSPADGAGLASGGLGSPTADPGGAPPTPVATATAGDAPSSITTPTPAPTAAPTATPAPAAVPDYVPGVAVSYAVGSGAVGAKDDSFPKATFDRPESIAVGVIDNSALYVGEPTNGIRKLLRLFSADTVNTWFTVGGMRPTGMSVIDGQIYVADAGRNQILTEFLIASSTFQSNLDSYAGASATGFVDGKRSLALFNAPRDVWATSADVFVADTGNGRIRQIGRGSDLVTSVASGLNGPESVAVAPDGTVWFADTGNHAIKKLVAGQVQLVAGGADGGAAGFADGQGAAARFSRPTGLTFAGNDLVVVDRGNHRLRLVSASGLVRTLAGTGATNSLIGAGSAAAFKDPADATAFKGETRVWVADSAANRVVEVKW